jgi:hypothetical protein
MKSFLKDAATLLFAPIVFLILVRFTGYRIFYNTNIKKRTVWLLSTGAFFYFVLIIWLVLK